MKLKQELYDTTNINKIDLLKANEFKQFSFVGRIAYFKISFSHLCSVYSCETMFMRFLYHSQQIQRFQISLDYMCGVQTLFELMMCHKACIECVSV